MTRESDRLVGVFGERHMELAALAILTAGLVDRVIPHGFGDAICRDGIARLRSYGWLLPTPGGLRASDEFKDRVRHER